MRSAILTGALAVLLSGGLLMAAPSHAQEHANRANNNGVHVQQAVLRANGNHATLKRVDWTDALRVFVGQGYSYGPYYGNGYYGNGYYGNGYYPYSYGYNAYPYAYPYNNYGYGYYPGYYGRGYYGYNPGYYGYSNRDYGHWRHEQQEHERHERHEHNEHHEHHEHH